MFLVLVIDGSEGEGGGQILRISLALSSLLSIPLRIENIRWSRPKPGLKPSHLASIRALSSLSSASVKGDYVGSTVVEFSPGRISGGHIEVDTGTAGSISLIIQAILPVMLFSGHSFSASISGGTDVAWSPPIDHTGEVLLPLLRDAGAKLELSVSRRGYYPRGGGRVEMSVSPSNFMGISSHPEADSKADSKADSEQVSGRLHISGLPAGIGKRLMDSAGSLLQKKGLSIGWSIESSDDICEELGCDRVVPEAYSPGVSAGLWYLSSGRYIGSFSIGRKGLPAEKIGHRIAEEFIADLESGATVDVHTADQILIYMALARIMNGSHSSFTVREMTSHSITAISIIEKMTELEFRRIKKGDLWEISL